MSFTETFSKKDKLRKSYQFDRVIEDGWRAGSNSFVVYGATNDVDRSRLGITASRKVGKAVERNWWKRHVREIFRRSRDRFPVGYDFVVIIRPKPKRRKHSELKSEVVQLFKEVARCD